MEDAGLEYVDCILIYTPINTSLGRKGVWRALAEAHEKGLTKSIGVSNYGITNNGCCRLE